MKPPTWRIGKTTFRLSLVPTAWFIGASRMSYGTWVEWTIYPLPMLQLRIWK